VILLFQLQFVIAISIPIVIGAQFIGLENVFNILPLREENISYVIRHFEHQKPLLFYRQILR